MKYNDEKQLRSLNENEIIYQIVHQIKRNGDYQNAYEIMQMHEITLDELVNKTLKLSQVDIAKLADVIIESSD